MTSAPDDCDVALSAVGSRLAEIRAKATWLADGVDRATVAKRLQEIEAALKTTADFSDWYLSREGPEEQGQSVPETADQSPVPSGKRRDLDAVATEEKAVLDHIVAAWDLFLRLPGKHPNDDEDFSKAVSQLQMIMAFRVAARVAPEVFGNPAGRRAVAAIDGRMEAKG